MAIEALVVLGLGVLFLAGLGLYAWRHRSEDAGKTDPKRIRHA